MKVKALVSFSGALTMSKGQIGEITDKVILSDLLQAKYIEEVTEKDVKPNESKRSNTRNTKKLS